MCRLHLGVDDGVVVVVVGPMGRVTVSFALRDRTRRQAFYGRPSRSNDPRRGLGEKFSLQGFLKSVIYRYEIDVAIAKAWRSGCGRSQEPRTE